MPRLRTSLSIALLISLFADRMASDFTPPGMESRSAAIGDLSSVEEKDRPAFDPSEGFSPLPKPKAGDWLYAHKERGQTFQQFVDKRFEKPSEKRNKLYIQPIGDFPFAEYTLDVLADYCLLYFNTSVEVSTPISLDSVPITSRKNPHTGQEQLLTTDILRWLIKNKPEDAYTIIAVTLTDLYPDSSWNFVFGQADYINRVGVFSFARYGDDYHQYLRRSLKTMTHEVGHMYGLLHCIYFKCLMNGSNSLSESDQTPLHLCPVCLRKLHHSAKLDLKARYESLAEFYRSYDFSEDAVFTLKQALRLTDITKPPKDK